MLLRPPALFSCSSQLSPLSRTSKTRPNAYAFPRVEPYRKWSRQRSAADIRPRERDTAHRPSHRGGSVGRAYAVRYARATRLLARLSAEWGRGESQGVHAGHFHSRVLSTLAVPR